MEKSRKVNFPASTKCGSNLRMKMYDPASQRLYLSMYLIKSLFHIDGVNTIGMKQKFEEI